MIKCVLFDLDGTLLDDEKFTITSKIIEGKKLGYIVKRKDVIASLGMSKANSYKHFTSIYGNDFPVEFLAKKRVEYILDDMKQNGIKLKPYANYILSYLRKNNFVIGLCTSSEEYKIKEYSKYGDLFTKFDFIITGDQIKNGKPSPDIFLKGLELSKCHKEEVLVIEDANTGVEASLNAGLKVIMIPDLGKPSGRSLEEKVIRLKNLKEAKLFIEEYNKEKR